MQIADEASGLLQQPTWHLNQQFWAVNAPVAVTSQLKRSSGVHTLAALPSENYGVMPGSTWANE